MFPLIYQHVCNVRVFGKKVRFLLGVNTILLVSFFVQYRKFNLCAKLTWENNGLFVIAAVNMSKLCNWLYLVLTTRPCNVRR